MYIFSFSLLPLLLAANNGSIALALAPWQLPSLEPHRRMSTSGTGQRRHERKTLLSPLVPITTRMSNTREDGGGDSGENLYDTGDDVFATMELVNGQGVNGDADVLFESSEAPSDVEKEEVEAVSWKERNSVDDDASLFTASSTSSFSKSSSLERNLLFLQSLGAITLRGEFASKQQHKSALSTIVALEGENPTAQPTLSPRIRGRWVLVYSSTTQLFRSSPFFMAGRAVCSTQSQADQYNWFCDMHRKALSISTIGPVRQVVSEDRLVSEFEVKAGAVPFLSDLTPFSYSGGLPVSIDGAIVSSADLTPLSDGSGWELLMDTVEIKGSNIPVVRQILDQGLKLQSRQLGNLLESGLLRGSYTNPRPVFRTTYLDETFRISRDQDDNAFVYVKTSDDTTPTDYSVVDSDLGVGRLLEGFNDAFTKFYL